MGYYISPELGYYEGDPISPADTAVPQRPDATYQWVNGAWVTNPVAAAQAKYSAALGAGCPIVSSATPALNGTYGVQPSDLLMVSGEQVYILTRQSFSNGQSSRGWQDVAGTYHTLPSIAEGEALFSALAGYVDALKTALAVAQGGGAWVAPAQPVTIA